jgi:hypothetical protein
MLRLISLMVKVNANEPVLVLYKTLDCINPAATKKRNLETVKVKLPDLLYVCDRTPLKKQGFVSQDHIRGFSMK